MSVHSDFASSSYLILEIINLLFVVYYMVKEIRSIHQLKWNHLRQFWAYIQWGIIVCSWTALGLYVWRYREMTRIGSLFRLTNGSAYVNLQLAAYIDDILTFLLGFSCFFASIKLLRFSRYVQRLSLLGETLRYASKDLVGFLLSFSIVFLAFTALFYLLFASKMWACANLLHTVQTLFEMILLKFDAAELTSADAFLGPLSFTIFILLLVFVGITMFISIINGSFRTVRKRTQMHTNEDHRIFAFMWSRFLQRTGIRKADENDGHGERDRRLRSEYVDPVDGFPEKMDQLLEALNRVISSHANEMQRGYALLV